MTKERETLRLALEALVAAFQGKDKTGQVTDAITAIREALASSVATSDTSEKRVDETAKQRHEAQPEQEPVAYLDEGLGAFYWAKDYKKHVGFKPLYTTPPQRKPLTDEEIADLWSAQIFFINDLKLAKDFVRDIEAAHGIKE